MHWIDLFDPWLTGSKVSSGAELGNEGVREKRTSTRNDLEAVHICCVLKQTAQHRSPDDSKQNHCHIHMCLSLRRVMNITHTHCSLCASDNDDSEKREDI